VPAIPVCVRLCRVAPVDLIDSEFKGKELSVKSGLVKETPCQERTNLGVLPNLDVFFCCFAVSMQAKGNVLFLGNLNESSFASLATKAKSNPALKRIASIGPEKLAAESKIAPCSPSSSPCEFCLKNIALNQKLLSRGVSSD